MIWAGLAGFLCGIIAGIIIGSIGILIIISISWPTFIQTTQRIINDKE